jgi:hypothetical protein
MTSLAWNRIVALMSAIGLGCMGMTSPTRSPD